MLINPRWGPDWIIITKSELLFIKQQSTIWTEGQGQGQSQQSERKAKVKVKSRSNFPGNLQLGLLNS